ncbi:hypothetical protein U4E84_13305 [Halorubrum sp. AD140]|nr:hypothetical protein [Halorubrum sp. AD140]
MTLSVDTRHCKTHAIETFEDVRESTSPDVRSIGIEPLVVTVHRRLF